MRGMEPPPTGTYLLRNTGLAAAEHRISPGFDELPTRAAGVGRFLSLDVVGCMGNPIHLTGPNLTRFEKGNRSLRDVPNDGRIQIAPGQAAKVQWVYATKRRLTDKFTWVTILPARSFTRSVAM